MTTTATIRQLLYSLIVDIICLFIMNSIEGESADSFTWHTCNFNDKTSNLNLCECRSIWNRNGFHVRCWRQSWLTKTSIIAISVTESSLIYLHQDAFKNQSIQLLDFTHNNIEIINANAFRSLENSLHQLILNHNALSTIPTWSLTYLHQLRYLYLQNNMIEDIKSDMFNETNLNNLQFMHLDHNKISVLQSRSLNHLPLYVLTCSSNRIDEIEKLALPPTLWFLDLKNNVLEEIPYLALRELKSLRILDLEGNNITYINPNNEVEFNTNMDLILSNNKLTSLGDNAFSSFQRFDKLDLSYNQISVISGNAFNSIGFMQQLDMSYNKIVHMPQDTLMNVGKCLQRLSLDENNLHKLPAALQPLRSLEYLSINGNKLITLDNKTVQNFKASIVELLLAHNRLTEIPTDALNGMSKLQNLDVSKNRIKRISKLAFGRFDGTGTTLTRLNLAGNLISTIDDPGSFLYMSSLVYLDLSYNRIGSISDNVFDRLEGLESLFLQNNQLRTFPKTELQGLRSLRYLLLDDNPIESLPDSALVFLEQIERVSLSRTNIYAIRQGTFSRDSVSNLKSLNLASNQVRHIESRAFHRIPNLKQILLNNNELRTINSWVFSSLYSLEQLNLAKNNIKTIMKYGINNVSSLEQLSLAHNQIERLEKSSMVDLENLENFDISHNKLKSFDLHFLQQDVIKIKTVDLSYNDIVSVDISLLKQSLIALNLNHNRLQLIKDDLLHEFKKLEMLDLSYNEIIEIKTKAFHTCQRLARLRIGNNHLRTLQKGLFSHQQRYEVLDLSHNSIVRLEFDTFGNNNINHLNLSYNDLRSVPKQALESVQNSINLLQLQGNQIKTLNADDFIGMNNLSVLILSENKIETIEEAAFANMPKLTLLDLSHNPVTSWNPHAFKELSHSIVTLNLAETGLYSLPTIPNRNLRSLNVSRNNIKELNVNDMADHKKLSILDLSYNNMNHLSTELLHRLSEIKNLNISGNRIEKITEEHLKELYCVETLTINDMPMLNKIPEAQSFRHLRHLRYLHLSHQPQIKYYEMSEMLRYLPPLRELAIEIKEENLSNQFFNVDGRFLRKITITGKQLKKIETIAFSRLRGYKINLTVRDTSIRYFPPTIFNTLTSVSFLSLSLINNNLETFEPFPHTKPPVLNQHGTILQDLELSGNKINCDCRLEWIKQWLRYYEATHSNQASPLGTIKCSNEDRFLLDYVWNGTSHCLTNKNAECDIKMSFSIFLTITSIVLSLN